MGFEDEDAIAEYQKGLEVEESDGEASKGAGGDSDDEEDQLLDIETIKMRDELTEKQHSLISKIEGIRRQFKRLIDKKGKLQNQEELEFDDTQIKGELKGIDKRSKDLKEQLERAEDKLRTSLKMTKKTKKRKDDEEDEEEEVAAAARRKNSDDEEDEFFDRTKHHAFNAKPQFDQEGTGEAVETYESIKSKLESLLRDRMKLTESMHQFKVSQKNAEEEEDELEAYMKATENQLRIEEQKKNSITLQKLNSDIDHYTKLIAMVAPASFNKRAAPTLAQA